MQSHQKTVGRLIAVAVLAFSFTSRAALTQHNFSNADQSWDLARVEAWGDGGFPTADEAATLTTTFGIYHVSSNINLNAIWAYLYSTPTTNIIDQTDYPEVTVSLPQGIALRRPNMNLTFRGGTWDFKNTGTIAANGGYNVGPSGSVTLDGVMATNAANVSIAYSHTGSRLVVTNGSHVVTDGFYLLWDFSYNCFYGQYDSTVRLTGENASNKYFWMPAKGGYGNTAVFSGANTRYEVLNTTKSPYSYIFSGNDGPHDNLMRIEKGAKVLLGNTTYFSTGTGAPHDNRLVVTGDGSLLTASEIVANSVEGRDNSIEVNDGGSIQLPTTFKLTGEVSLIVSNGMVGCKGISVGQSDGEHGCRVFVKGDESVICVTNFNFFNKGYGHLWELDGARLDYPDKAAGWSASNLSLSSNVVRFVNGASAKFLYLCVPVWSKATTTTTGNEVFVGASSTLELTQQMRIMNDSNRIVVSNGTLVVNASGADNTNLIVGYSDTDTFTTNCMLVLQGTHPKVR